MRSDVDLDTVAYVRRRLVSGGSWVIGARAAAVVLSLTVNGLLARLLSPGEMGTYFLAFSVANLLSIVARMGFPQTTVRLVAESMARDQPQEARAIVRQIFLCVALATIVTGFAAASPGGNWMTARVFNSPDLPSIMPTVGIWAAAITFQILLAETFRGFHDIRLASLITGFVTNLTAVFLLAAVFFYRGQSNLQEAIALSIIAMVLTVCVAASLLGRKLLALPRGGSPKLKAALRIAWPLVVSNIGWIALMQGGIWIVGAVLNPEDTALYGAATRLALLLAVPIALSNAVLSPLVVELHTKRNRTAMQHVLRMVVTLTSLPTLLVATAFIAFPSPILQLAFGQTYQAAATTFSVLVAGQLIMAFVGAAGITLITTGHQRVLMTITATAGVGLVGLGPWITAHWGIVGMAILTSSALAVANLSIWLAARLKSRVWTHPYLTVQQMRRVPTAAGLRGS